MCACTSSCCCRATALVRPAYKGGQLLAAETSLVEYSLWVFQRVVIVGSCLVVGEHLVRLGNRNEGGLTLVTVALVWVPAHAGCSSQQRTPARFASSLLASRARSWVRERSKKLTEVEELHHYGHLPDEAELAIGLLDLGHFGLFSDSKYLIGLVATLFEKGTNALPILNAHITRYL